MFLINGKNYSIKPTTLKDYGLISEIFTSIQLPFIPEGERTVLALGMLIDRLIENKLVEKFLSLILIDETGECISTQDAEQITDVTLLEVIKTFADLKKNLILSITSVFQN